MPTKHSWEQEYSPNPTTGTSETLIAQKVPLSLEDDSHGLNVIDNQRGAISKKMMNIIVAGLLTSLVAGGAIYSCNKSKTPEGADTPKIMGTITLLYDTDQNLSFDNNGNPIKFIASSFDSKNNIFYATTRDGKFLAAEIDKIDDSRGEGYLVEKLTGGTAKESNLPKIPYPYNPKKPQPNSKQAGTP